MSRAAHRVTRRVILLVQLSAEVGALERVLGLLRRRAVPVDEMSISPRMSMSPPSTLGPDVLLHLAGGEEVAGRTIAELSRLRVVQSVTPVDVRDERSTRELALARVHSPRRTYLPANGRLIDSDDEGDLVELTGSPEEIDHALEQLAQSGVLSGATRTGALLVPVRTPTTTDQNGRIST